MSGRITYFDNNATTKVDPRVLESMLPYFQDYYFNANSAYESADFIKESIEKSRMTLSKFFGGVDSRLFTFTGSASESNNMAIQGVLKMSGSRNHIITTKVEHPAVISQCKMLEREGHDVTYLSVNENGELSLKELINSIRPDTAIVSIMHVNNETGVIFPIEKLAKIVKKTDPEIIFHTDATQAIGKIDIDLMKSFAHVDMLSFSGHKIYAPKGVGALYCKRNVKCRPLIVGGHQENGKRAGTENVAYIVALAKALEVIIEDKSDEKSKKLAEMRNSLEQFVLANISGVKINGMNAKRVDSASNISFQGIEGEGIIYALNDAGYCASTGSACSSGDLTSSHVLKAMGIPFSYAHGSLRVSFGRFNCSEEVELFKTELVNLINKLRQLSPFWNCDKDQYSGPADE